MSLKTILDRKLLMLIVSPILRRLGTALAVYLVSKGAPTELVDQFVTALLAILGLSSDLVLATVARKRSEKRGEEVASMKMADAIDRHYVNADHVFMDHSAGAR